MKLKRILRSGKLLLAVLLLSLLVAISCVPSGTTVPRGWSGPAVANGALFIGSREGKLVALNTSDSQHVWPDVALEPGAASSGGFGCTPAATSVAIYGSPTVSGDLVYLGGYNGKFYAFSAGKGNLRWVYPRDRNLLDFSGKVAPIVGSAVVAQEKVFFGASNGIVYALEAATGDKLWEFDTKSKIWSTPAILNDTLFIGTFDKKLYALDIATGKPKWAKPFETQGAIVATPAVDDNTVYIGSFDRHLDALDAATGQLKWEFTEARNWFWAKPVISNNVIYAASLDGKVYALDARDGKKLDEFNLGTQISASPVVVGNLVVAATEDGVVYALGVGKEKKELRKLGEKVQAPLSTDGTVVYIHNAAGKVNALNAQSGAEAWPTVSLKPVAAPASTGTTESGRTNWWLVAIFTAGSLLMIVIFQVLLKRRGTQ